MDFRFLMYGNLDNDNVKCMATAPQVLPKEGTCIQCQYDNGTTLPQVTYIVRLTICSVSSNTNIL